jgi:chromosome segregation ATPase
VNHAAATASKSTARKEKELYE